MTAVLDGRADLDAARVVRSDALWLVALTLLLVATGVGLRDPWPPDEPRFALIARDMALSGEWLAPQVGGDIYADKPPLFFWLVSALFWLTGSISMAVLAPGVIAAVGCVLLVQDLARRLWGREAGWAAALALLGTVQFVWAMRQGQIDALLCLLTTLALYGFLRHLLLGPAWRWWFAAWFAAGLGVITKGVGFLPILVLVPYALARGAGWITAAPAARDWRWWVGPLAMLGAIGVWLGPMLAAAAVDPALAAYRDEILFTQTIDRYASAWHHREPFWYFIVEVIPGLWLPLIALLPWLAPRWRTRWSKRDVSTWLPLSWLLLVLLFFSLSSGKRGVYILPAVPAFALACAPILAELVRRRGPNIVMFAIACAIPVIAGLAALYLFLDPAARTALQASYGIDGAYVLGAAALVTGALCMALKISRGFLAYGGVLAAVLLFVSFWINPAIDAVRSGAQFMRRVERLAAGAAELGIVEYKEQYLLQSSRPTVNFGHARWRDYRQETFDAAAWLDGAEDRVLLVNARAFDLCFRAARAREVGEANRLQWFLVSGPSDPQCSARGDVDAARLYAPSNPR